MGFRRIKAKKYSGISEYYRDSDIDKKTVAYYIDYRDIEIQMVKEKRLKLKQKTEMRHQLI